MRSRECGEEVVQRIFVGDVHRRQSQPDFVLIAMQQVVLSQRDVEQVSRSDPRWILVRILGVGSRDRKQLDVSPAASQAANPAVGVAFTPSQASPAWNC